MAGAPRGWPRRLAGHWALAVVCALFLLAGIGVVDDYGISPDESNQRRIGNVALDYLAGEGERAFDQLNAAFPHDRYYGAALEAPLALLERLFDANQRRESVIARHLFTHVLFLCGGIFCYALVQNMFRNRMLSLIAVILFLVHPRIYAHSFFNSKDVPFLAMFMVSLYLVHRAFRRDTLAAFLLCGVGVGLLVNLRILGIVLFAAVLALCALDLLTASGAAERRRALLTGGAFALAAILTFHASLPVLWTDPFGRFAEMLGELNAHPHRTFNLFRGQWLYAPDGPPLDYLPVWVGITTPPATLLLALAGVVALVRGGLRRPRDLPRRTPLRFGCLLLILPLAAMAGAVVFGSNVYHDWRQLFFLYAPLLLLAILGLRWLTPPTRARRVRAGGYALAGMAVAAAVVAAARIHPYQDSYFNSLTDRNAPQGLESRYVMDYWAQSVRDMQAGIVGDHPSGTLFVAMQQQRHRRLLSAHDRERLVDTIDFRSGARNFYRLRDRRLCVAPLPADAYLGGVYANTLHCMVDPVAYFGGLRRRALAAEPLDRSRFSAHRVDGAMVYLRDECPMDDTGTRFFLHVHPVDPADLPDPHLDFGQRGAYGFERLDFAFARYGARIDGNCVAVVPLPAYPIARIHTGQYTPRWAALHWRAAANDEPLVRSRFDVYLAGRVLTYVRDECAPEDIAAAFFLHVYPAGEDDLPGWRAEHGFNNFDFGFGAYGARADDGRCVAAVPLPAWPIARIHTGQFGDGERLWETAFAPPAGE